MSVSSIIEDLKSKGNAKNVEGMARFGISARKTLGVSIPGIRSIARKVGTNHQIALKLWRTGIHEARILPAMVDDPKEVTDFQMERWARDFVR